MWISSISMYLSLHIDADRQMIDDSVIHIIMEAEKSQDLPFASSRTKAVNGKIQHCFKA